MATVHGAPTGTRSNPTSLDDSSFGPILLLNPVDSPETLVDHLRGRYKSQLDGTLFKSYELIMTHHWQVWKLDHCQAEIRPPSAIATSLYCDPASSTDCQLSFKYTDTETISIQDGVRGEFSVSAGGGVPGVFEAKITASVSVSHTTTNTYNHGVEFSYTFPVGVGRMCTPSIVYYFLQCEGTHWDVDDNPLPQTCSDVVTRIDFKDRHRWFADPSSNDWFHYVHEDKSLGDQLWSFQVKSESLAPPKSCEDVVQFIHRTLADRRDGTSTEAFLGLNNGESLSVASCIYN
ncbi:hypothetical protein BGZ72_002638 [Mortierella alpina]|nr:hypothetical protein BGZ72_002638 [Mortierella alpina]